MEKQLRILLFLFAVVLLILSAVSFLFFPFYTSAGYLKPGMLIAGLLLLIIGTFGGYGILYFLNRSRIEYYSYIDMPDTYRSPFSTFARNEQARKADKALLFALPLLILSLIISRRAFFTWLMMAVVMLLIHAHIIFNGEVAKYCGVRFDPIVKRKKKRPPQRRPAARPQQSRSARGAGTASRRPVQNGAPANRSRSAPTRQRPPQYRQSAAPRNTRQVRPAAKRPVNTANRRPPANTSRGRRRPE